MKPWLNTQEAKDNRSKSMKKWWEENRDNPQTLLRNKRISKNRKGIMHTEEAKEKIRQGHIGIPISEKTKEAVRRAQTGRIVSEETKKKMSEGMKGIPKSLEAKRKMKIAAIERWQNNEYRNNFIKSRKGEKNPNWHGGIQYEPYDNNWTRNFKHYIRERDNQVCMNCGIHKEQLNYSFDVHHVNYDKKLSVKENCISLCHVCHSLTQINREYWTTLFYDKLSRLYGYKYTKDNQIIFNLQELKGGITEDEKNK